MSKITLADVAKRAGVSLQTVSRVINQTGETSDRTRKSVLLAIQETGYRPNRLARGLRSQTTKTIGVVVPAISNPFFPDILQGIEGAAFSAGYSVIIANSGEDLTREVDVLNAMDDRRVDGLILCSPRQPDKSLREMLQRHHAAVVINRVVSDDIAGCIRVDYEAGIRAAVVHLHAQKRSNLVLLCVPEASHGGRERIRGFRAALRPLSAREVAGRIYSGPASIADAYAATEKLLLKRPNVQGILCYNDIVAAGALQALKRARRKVPDDVAVIGFDNISLAGVLAPTLTTFNIDKLDIGRRAMGLLIERLKGSKSQPCQVVLPELIERESA